MKTFLNVLVCINAICWLILSSYEAGATGEEKRDLRDEQSSAGITMIVLLLLKNQEE